MQSCRGKHKICYPPSNSPPFLPRILAGAQLETGAVHKLCSQQILFINRQIPSSARYFRPFQAKQKDLRYTNYLRSSLSLRYFSGEFLCRVVGGSTKFVLPHAKNSPIPPRKMSHCAARPKPLSYPPCRRPACYFASEPDSFRAALRWWLLVCFPPFKKQLSNVIFSYVAQRPVKSNFELAGRWHQRDSIFLAKFVKTLSIVHVLSPHFFALPADALFRKRTGPEVCIGL